MKGKRKFDEFQNNNNASDNEEAADADDNDNERSDAVVWTLNPVFSSVSFKEDQFRFALFHLYQNHQP